MTSPSFAIPDTHAPGDLQPIYRKLPGLYLDGTGDYASTPDHADLDITGDLDIRVAAALTDWTPAAGGVLVDKDITGTAYYFNVQNGSTGRLNLGWTDTVQGAQAEESSVAPTVSNGAPLLVRVTLDIVPGNFALVKFYTRLFYPNTFMDDLEDDTVAAGAWVQLGLTQSTVVNCTAIVTNSDAVRVGSGINGRIFGAVIKNGIDGTTVANPNFMTRASRTAAFSDTAPTPKTWSMNGDAYMQLNYATADWLYCDGSVLNIADYPILFEAIGDVAGGDGVTTFAVPDMSDRFPRGSLTPGATGGADTHTHNTHTTAGSHQHEAHGTATNTPTTGGAARLTGNALPGGNQHGADGGHTHDAHSTSSNVPGYVYTGWLIHI